MVCDRLMVSKQGSRSRPWRSAPTEGRRARGDVPRSVHGGWQPAPDRADPVDLLEEQATTRVPELVPIRYGRMLVSPFTFYRGAAYLMASDLADTPRTGLTVQLCGDAHLSNFGVFAAPDRRLVFSINDFDETLPGPFEWDVKRLVTSFAVAGRDRGFDAEEREAVNLAVTQAYRRVDGRLRGDAHDGGVDLAPRHGRDREALGVADGQAGPEAVRPQRRQGPRQGQRAGLQEARHRRRRTSPGSSGIPR